MPEVSITLIISSFIAGVFMFLAPCTLPMVPAYLAFISGVKQKDADSKEVRNKIIRNAVAFVVGFGMVFTFFGVLAGFFGGFAGAFREILTQVGGVFIILFGLMMLNVIKIAPLLKTHTFELPSFITPGKSSSAFIIGSIFAIGWTPCVGPVLATVLLLATTSATAFSGGLLLAVFSLGLAVPFLLTAFLYARANATIMKYSRVSEWISIVGGIFLIGIGALLLTDNFGLTVEYGYRVFNFFGFEGLFDLY